MDHLEYMTDKEFFYDFCLWEYEPIAPYQNKFRSANLLFHSFEVAGFPKRVFDIINAIRQGIGISHTVWGLKFSGDDISWEFYFYDYRRKDRQRSMTKLLDIVRPYLRCEIEANENPYYFMFSIDIDRDLISGAKGLDEIHMYIGNPGSSVSSGICYSLTRQATRLENFYFFFDAKKHMNDILDKIACSAHIDSTRIQMDQIIWPELRNCKVIVVANKQHNDGIYFTRVNVNQLIFFLKKMNYPADMTAFVEENRSNLDHLLFDVSYDYRMDGNDLVLLKSGYYGTF